MTCHCERRGFRDPFCNAVGECAIVYVCSECGANCSDEPANEIGDDQVCADCAADGEAENRAEDLHNDPRRR